MAIRIAIVGPGRVGSAMARRFARAGACIEGFVGRTAEAVTAAVQFCGAGRQLGWTDLVRAHAVVFAVGDGDLETAVAAAVAGGGARPCALWLHTSGRHGLGVFGAAAGAGLRHGSLHPVAPFADAASGAGGMAGAPAVLDGDPQSERMLQRLCRLLGMVPVRGAGLDRILYHAACALAANGLTALRELVDRAFSASGPLSTAERQLLADALMGAALRASSAVGPAVALSGPVRRGDAATVALHLARLGESVPESVDAYRALMTAAVTMAARQGLPAAAAARLRACLGQSTHGGLA